MPRPSTTRSARACVADSPYLTPPLQRGLAGAARRRGPRALPAPRPRRRAAGRRSACWPRCARLARPARAGGRASTARAEPARRRAPRSTRSWRRRASSAIARWNGASPPTASPCARWARWPGPPARAPRRAAAAHGVRRRASRRTRACTCWSRPSGACGSRDHARRPRVAAPWRPPTSPRCGARPPATRASGSTAGSPKASRRASWPGSTSWWCRRSGGRTARWWCWRRWPKACPSWRRPSAGCPRSSPTARACSCRRGTRPRSRPRSPRPRPAACSPKRCRRSRSRPSRRARASCWASTAVGSQAGGVVSGVLLVHRGYPPASSGRVRDLRRGPRPGAGARAVPVTVLHPVDDRRRAGRVPCERPTDGVRVVAINRRRPRPARLRGLPRPGPGGRSSAALIREHAARRRARPSPRRPVHRHRLRGAAPRRPGGDHAPRLLARLPAGPALRPRRPRLRRAVAHALPGLRRRAGRGAPWRSARPHGALPRAAGRGRRRRAARSPRATGSGAPSHRRPPRRDARGPRRRGRGRVAFAVPARPDGRARASAASRSCPTATSPRARGAAERPTPPAACASGFIGAAIPSKGVHVLAEAFRRLDDAGADAAPSTAPFLPYHGDTGYEAARAAASSARRTRRDPRPVPARASAAGSSAGSTCSWCRRCGRRTRPSPSRRPSRHGVPVVVSDHGGLAERVRHDVDGLRFPPGDADALAAALRRLVHEPGLRARLAAARAAVRSRWRRTSMPWTAVYARAARALPRAPGRVGVVVLDHGRPEDAARAAASAEDPVVAPRILVVRNGPAPRPAASARRGRLALPAQRRLRGGDERGRAALRAPAATASCS